MDIIEGGKLKETQKQKAKQKQKQKFIHIKSPGWSCQIELVFDNTQTVYYLCSWVKT